MLQTLGGVVVVVVVAERRSQSQGGGVSSHWSVMPEVFWSHHVVEVNLSGTWHGDCFVMSVVENLNLIVVVVVVVVVVQRHHSNVGGVTHLVE